MRRIAFAVVFAALATPGLAQMPRPVGPPPVGAAPLTTDQVLNIAFSEIERKMIGDYYARLRTEEERRATRAPATQGRGAQARGPDQAAPPGLANREAPPPGLQSSLARHGTLPPGLAKKALPTDLDRLLPRPAYGTERTIVDGNVLLVQIGTGLILDVLENALTGTR
jgi:hypothetical protein